MDLRSIYAVLDRMLDTSKTAVLATAGKDGAPHVRWMTPTMVKGHDNALFAVTSPDFAKAVQVQDQPKVEWMFQSKSLDEILTIRGVMEVIDNPRTKAEVLETLGGNLGAFWRVNHDPSQLIVLETTMTEAIHYKPMTGERSAVSIH